ncbi:MAG: hypothetical protein JNM68_10950 [Dinghuibacter sp.]|nr:hypothetical protein [Dinghuibacter sp.]
MLNKKTPAVTFILAILAAQFLTGCAKKNTTDKRLMSFNNSQFIEGLYTRVQTDSPREVFNYIFSSLPDEVTVYPSENVFYFRNTFMGKTYDGTITLYPRDRDSGRLGFGYVNRKEDRRTQKYYELKGGSHDFTVKDGLLLKKQDTHTYLAEYRDKKVLFRLHVLPDTAPRSLKLLPVEKWVMTTFDESGLQFHAIFNEQVNKFYWVLNEAAFVPESFRPVSTNMYIGDRTEFVFYRDTLRNRKILVGVNGENVMQNNWYDGPFDHLADNRIYAGKLNLKPMLEKHYPSYKDKIDNYGHFIGKTGTRVALAPYTVYFSVQDMQFVDSLAKIKTNESDFLSQITVQQYDVPDGYYNFGESVIMPKNSKKEVYRMFRWGPGSF